ncbi:MAG: hypothetical protein M1388_04270 [Thaumarchaeota archaeon]|nr:hypothetical protein [Nitrososphaerota archaeon]
MSSRTWLSSKGMLFIFLVLVALGSVAAAFLTFYYLVSSLGLGPEAPGWSVAAVLVLLVIDMVLIAAFWPRAKGRRGDVRGSSAIKVELRHALFSLGMRDPCKTYWPGYGIRCLGFTVYTV